MSFTVSWETLDGSESERAYPTLDRAMRVWRAIAGADKVKWSDVHDEASGELLACHYGPELRYPAPPFDEPPTNDAPDAAPLSAEDRAARIADLKYQATLIEHQDRMSDADHKRLRALKDEIGRLQAAS